MKKLKNKILLDFKDKFEHDTSFDTSKLESNDKNRFFKLNFKRIARKTFKFALIGSLCAIVLTPVISFLSASVKDSFSSNRRVYSINELKAIENASFKRLNNVVYPSTEAKLKKVDEEYKNAVIDFALETYLSLEQKDNIAFSPLNLYSLLDILSLCSDDENVSKQFDSILKIGKEKRNLNYKNMYETNYFVSDKASIQMYNGMFTSNMYEKNEDLIDDLTNKYTDVYELDFTKREDLLNMVSWMNQRVNDDDFIKLENLDVQEDSLFYLMSTMYFKSSWAYKYVTRDSFTDLFYQGNNSFEAKYMNHKYIGSVYRYDKYISCYDYYWHGQKIQYLIPIDKNDDIHELIKDKNFMVEDEEFRLENEYHSDPVIDLTVPKFEISNFIDFTDILINNGLNLVFDSNYNSMNRIFNEDINVYLDWIKQKNEIQFNEDGTVFKTIAISLGAGAAAPVVNEITINLNQPFIYVIYDTNGLPIQMGNIDNPTLN